MALCRGSVGMEGRSLNKSVGVRLGKFLTRCQAVWPFWKVSVVSSGQSRDVSRPMHQRQQISPRHLSTRDQHSEVLTQWPSSLLSLKGRQL